MVLEKRYLQQTKPVFPQQRCLPPRVELDEVEAECLLIVKAFAEEPAPNTGLTLVEQLMAWQLRLETVEDGGVAVQLIYFLLEQKTSYLIFSCSKKYYITVMQLKNQYKRPFRVPVYFGYFKKSYNTKKQGDIDKSMCSASQVHIFIQKQIFTFCKIGF